MDDELADFVRARYSHLLRRAYLLTGNQLAAEDLVQEALARCCAAWRRHPITEPDAYVHRVMVNVLISRSRLRRFRESSTAAVPEIGTVDATSQHADRDAVWRALLATPPRQRAVLVLRFYEGHDRVRDRDMPERDRRNRPQPDREGTGPAASAHCDLRPQRHLEFGGPAMTDDLSDDMEEQLRAVLRQRATVPSASSDPVASVQHRMRRRAVRRGVAAATTAAACVAGIAIGATALAGNETARPAGPAVGSSNPLLILSASPAPAPDSSPPSSRTASAPPTSAASSVLAAPSPSSSETLPSNVSARLLPATDTFSGLSTDSGQLLPDRRGLVERPEHAVRAGVSGSGRAHRGCHHDGELRRSGVVGRSGLLRCQQSRWRFDRIHLLHRDHSD